MQPINSYHDVSVEVNGERHLLSNLPYGYQISCSREDGWQLRLLINELLTVEDDLLSGNDIYDDQTDELVPFRMWFGETLVVDTLLD
ncbi:hypothetical protein N6P31_12780 [Pectobacterium betavasculorum]|uniref:hypothetical protein n=1 Tax=Pectobacterium betavasculorum TaxID=55207 RepID=UPI00313D1D51